MKHTLIIVAPSPFRSIGRLTISLLVTGALLLLFRYYGSVSVQGNRLSAQDLEMVDLAEVVPEIVVDLKYCSADNICHRPLYLSERAYLRRGTAEKLRKAQEEFAALGLRIKVWDAYRPPQVQHELWKAMPDPRFVINPNQGVSYHSRGCALDITLVDKSGQELPMPTGFDDFSTRANRDYKGVSPERAANAKILEKVMLKHGFTSIYYEWWHFIDTDRENYDLVKGDGILMHPNQGIITFYSGIIISPEKFSPGQGINLSPS